MIWIKKYTYERSVVMTHDWIQKQTFIAVWFLCVADLPMNQIKDWWSRVWGEKIVTLRETSFWCHHISVRLIPLLSNGLAYLWVMAVHSCWESVFLLQHTRLNAFLKRVNSLNCCNTPACNILVKHAVFIQNRSARWEIASCKLHSGQIFGCLPHYQISIITLVNRVLKKNIQFKDDISRWKYIWTEIKNEISSKCHHIKQLQ